MQHDYPIRIRGKNTWRRQLIYQGVSLVGCVASFQVKNLDAAGLPSTTRLELTSGVDAGLTITHLTEAATVRGVVMPIGSGVVTLQISETDAEAIPVGKYLHELKLIWPAVGGEAVKEPLIAGPLFRDPTINSA
jgi:hypothetical protein